MRKILDLSKDINKKALCNYASKEVHQIMVSYPLKYYRIGFRLKGIRDKPREGYALVGKFFLTSKYKPRINNFSSSK